MITPTRMELNKTKKKLVTATRGHKLLKDKRDELMRRFLETINECNTLRTYVEDELAEINRAFVVARAEMSDEAVNIALSTPKYEVELEGGLDNIMSVDVPKLTLKSFNNVNSYGEAFTNEALDIATERLRTLFPKLIKLTEKEHACRLMADEVEKTRRRVNALEHVIIPRAQEDIHYISMKLSENERANQIRLMKVKDMMLEARINNQAN